MDRSFLSQVQQKMKHVKVKLSQTLPYLWLWYFPYGTGEEDIKSFFRKMSQEITVEPVLHEDTFVGYKLTVGMSFLDNNYLDVGGPKTSALAPRMDCKAWT